MRPFAAVVPRPSFRSRLFHVATLFVSLLFFILTFFLVSTTTVHAGTITIVPGTDSGASDVYGDEYIANQLDAGHFQLDTSLVGGTPHEIHIMPGVNMTWTSGFSLTLIAQDSIVISGTIQHNGPIDGSGGISLLAGGDVVLGTGAQLDAINVGSRFGLTRVAAENVRLTAAASGDGRHTQLGYFDINTVSPISTTGPISITAAMDVAGQAGSGEFNYVQIGHGGVIEYTTSAGEFGGDIEVVAGDNIIFNGGGDHFSYAQIGNGAAFGDGVYTGNHTLIATNNITFAGGPERYTHVHIGNGGFNTESNAERHQTGSHTVIAQNGNIALISGMDDEAYALLGNGGRTSTLNVTGDHTVRAGQDILLVASNGDSAPAQIGNGGLDARGYAGGNLSVVAGRNIILDAPLHRERAYVQIGHGGGSFQILAGYPQTSTGDIEVIALSGYISATGSGEDSYAQIGTQTRQGNVDGSILVTAALGISFYAGTDEDAHASIGHGDDSRGTGNMMGAITVAALDGDITFVGGSSHIHAFAIIGHHSSDGAVLRGDIKVTASGDIRFTGGSNPDSEYNWTQIGHVPFANGSIVGGNIDVVASQGDILFTASYGERSYALIGHGSHYLAGIGESNNINVLAGGKITFIASPSDADKELSFAQIGNVMTPAVGASNNVTVTALGGAITFLAGGMSPDSYAMVGTGGNYLGGNRVISGAVTLHAATDVVFRAGSGENNFALAGNGGVNSLSAITGSLTISAGGSISFTAGTGEYAFALAGNGGDVYSSAGTQLTGSHKLIANGSIHFQGGSNTGAYAQIGNGGYDRNGNYSGNMVVTSVAGDIRFTPGTVVSAYAQIGNGGYEANGSHSGDHQVEAAGDIVFDGATRSAYGQIGNAGHAAGEENTTTSGTHTITAGGGISFTGGVNAGAYVQIGNGGHEFTASTTGNITVTAGAGNIAFTAGTAQLSYAQIGNSGPTNITSLHTRSGSHSGDSIVTSRQGNVIFKGSNATLAYAQVGNGGAGSGIGEHSGDQHVTAGGEVFFAAGNGENAYAQVGNGGDLAYFSTFRGNQTVTAQMGNITFLAGTSDGAYVQVGNGGLDSFSPSYGILGAQGNQTLAAPNGDIVFTASDGEEAYALVGNGAGSSTRYSGDVSLAASGSITFTAGSGEGAFTQVGNGGYDIDSRSLGNSGNITVTTQSGDITFLAAAAYAQIGNGGYWTLGPMQGDIWVTAGGDVTFRAANSDYAYAQIGNGGYYGDARDDELDGHIGHITVTAQGGNITFVAGDAWGAYAQAGNGGVEAVGAHDGNVTLTAYDSIVFEAGDGGNAYAQAGNGSSYGNGRYGPYNGFGGNHSLVAQHGDILFTAGGGTYAYALAGNGGWDSWSDTRGNLSLKAYGDIRFTSSAGEYAYSQAGHGAPDSGGAYQTATVDLVAQTGDIAFIGGSGLGAYTHIGHGSYNSEGNKSGDISVQAAGTLTMSVGSGPGAYARIGHGDLIDDNSGNNGRGTRSGDITLHIGNDLVLQGTAIGHWTMDGVEAVTDANTYIAVSQNNPFATGTGGIHATNTAAFTTMFTSAPIANSGELRFYVPRAANVLLPADTPMNSEAFPGSVPDNRIAGFFLFADGPYIAAADYAFYLGFYSDLGVSKQVEPDGDLLPGQPLTYTITFSNSGVVTATQVAITDTFPAGVLFDLTLTSNLDPGVIITQTSSAPNLAWAVSDLAPGMGGTILVHGHALHSLNVPIGYFNRTGITGTLDLTPTNNSAFAYSIIDVPSLIITPTSRAVMENAGSVTFTATLSFVNPYHETVVNYATLDGSAVAGSDYVHASSIFTIPAGASSAPIIIAISDDALVEVAENFTVTLISAQGAGTYSNNQAVVTIHDDDSHISIGALDADQVEGNSGTTAFTFMVTRTGYLSEVVSVDYTVSGMVDAADFVGSIMPGGTITFALGESNQTITVPVQGDLFAESHEAFSVTLSNASSNAIIITSAANGTVRNDDVAPNLQVSKTPSVSMARVGETITYTYRITNSGGLTFTVISATDNQLGAVTLDKSSLNLGEVATGQIVYTVVTDDLPGPLVNTVTVTGVPVVGNDVVVSSDASVELAAAAFTFRKTTGIQGIAPECTATSSMKVPISTTVVYCFTITNTGSEPLTTHTLEDDHLGLVLDGANVIVAPGASYSITVPQTLYMTTTNTAIWTAGYVGSDSVSVAALPAQSTTQATVLISGDADDQDGDGIPDNLELASDVDRDNVPNFLDLDSDGDGRPDREECTAIPCEDSDKNGIPDFLDPNNATALEPEEQPSEQRPLFLPSVIRK